jgi:hypothetical protein
LNRLRGPRSGIQQGGSEAFIGFDKLAAVNSNFTFSLIFMQGSGIKNMMLCAYFQLDFY